LSRTARQALTLAWPSARVRHLVPLRDGPRVPPRYTRGRPAQQPSGCGCNTIHPACVVPIPFGVVLSFQACPYSLTEVYKGGCRFCNDPRPNMLPALGRFGIVQSRVSLPILGVSEGHEQAFAWPAGQSLDEKPGWAPLMEGVQAPKRRSQLLLVRDKTVKRKRQHI